MATPIKLYREKIFTRTMYCEKCAQNQAPRVGNIAVVYGQTSNRYYPLTIGKNSLVKEYGFTPHIISSPKMDWIDDREVVSFNKCCAMNGCGVQVRFFPDFNQYDHYFLEVNPDWLPTHDFLAMINFKDPCYYVYPKTTTCW